jgi:transcriptional regulator with XRE-family HTH domain
MSENEENLVKKTCKELGITQKELSEKTGFTIQSISKWNNGHKIPISATKYLNLLLDYKKAVTKINVLEDLIKN